MKLISTNKKAFRDYSFNDTYECGIELKGSEVKAVRAGGLNFKDSFARIDKGEIVLYNLHINPYAQASYMNVESDRERKLLLHKKEIRKISSLIAEKGLSLIPTKIYFNDRSKVKIELAIGRGKKMFDKRETVKKRTIDKALKRIVKVQR